MSTVSWAYPKTADGKLEVIEDNEIIRIKDKTTVYTFSKAISALVSIVDNGTAITVNTSFDPVQTVTKVSEVVLPSFERMDETYMIKVASSVSYSV